MIVFPPSSALEFMIKGEIRNYSVFLTESQFLVAARAVAGSDAVISPRSATLLDGDRKHLAAICQGIDSVLQSGDLDSENASNLLAETILWMADASSSSSAERLANGAAAAIAHRAQAFIEERFQDAIRMQDLCAFTGSRLRTLQRCFSSHFQVSPTEYIKARADASSRSIGAIAMDNGFTHLGRFSVDYRAHFGESPSETLAETKALGQKAFASHHLSLEHGVEHPSVSPPG
jgi:AraC-like DNA-binding protein